MSDGHATLREPWEDLSRQRNAATFGLWLFLASEVLFFGGMLLGYTMMRITYPHAFTAAARETEFWYGTVNTAVLLTSSLTMAVAVRSAKAGFAAMATWCLLATALIGTAFLVIKGFEYSADLDNDLWPGPGFKLGPTPGQIFWGFYWVLTAVHAVHLTVGIGLVLRLFFLAKRKWMDVTRNPSVEVTALYWHLVDIIWIVLYPLIYLVGRAS